MQFSISHTVWLMQHKLCCISSDFRHSLVCIKDLDSRYSLIWSIFIKSLYYRIKMDSRMGFPLMAWHMVHILWTIFDNDFLASTILLSTSNLPVKDLMIYVEWHFITFWRFISYSCLIYRHVLKKKRQKWCKQHLFLFLYLDLENFQRPNIH